MQPLLWILPAEAINADGEVVGELRFTTSDDNNLWERAKETLINAARKLFPSAVSLRVNPTAYGHKVSVT